MQGYDYFRTGYQHREARRYFEHRVMRNDCSDLDYILDARRNRSVVTSLPSYCPVQQIDLQDIVHPIALRGSTFQLPSNISPGQNNRENKIFTFTSPHTFPQ
jgi:hypothetical protein